MRIGNVMSRDVQVVNADATLRDAAEFMKRIDTGVLPVADGDRLVGMITDRDIAIRGVANGNGPDANIRRVMSPEVKYCFEDEEVDEVAQNMADIKVRRLPVLNRGKRLVGILSLGDIALTEGAGHAAGALCGISEPGGDHSQ